MSSKKARVLIAYQNVWDIADDLKQWDEMSQKVDFIKFRVQNKIQLEQYLAQNSFDAWWITEEFFEILGNPVDYIEYFSDSLKTLLVPWVGCDFLNAEELKRTKQIQVGNIGHYAADNVADLAVMLLCSCFRLSSQWEYCLRFLENGNINNTKKYLGGIQSTIKNTDSWSNGTRSTYICDKLPEANFKGDDPTKLAMQYTLNGKEMDSLTNKKVLIIGFGSIGQLIGKRLSGGFDMNVYYHRRSGPIADLTYKATYSKSLEDPSTWNEMDAIVLALPSSSSTNDLISAQTLSMCKTGVRIVNVGRGTCIDEEALIAALDSGKVNSCGLDVYKDESKPLDSRLLQRWDVTLLPHIGSAVKDIVPKQTIATLENIENIFFGNGKPKYQST